MSTHLVVRRDDLHQTRWVDQPPVQLEDGSVRLRIDAFALTSNNITYAVLGEAMNYWDFYPTGDATTGCIPVWGFASVVESRCAGVDVGERFDGFWPIADEVVLQPLRVNAGGFFDGAEHRRHLPPVYNRYVRCSADPAYAAEREGEQALLRPQFDTSFPSPSREGWLDDHIKDHLVPRSRPPQQDWPAGAAYADVPANRITQPRVTVCPKSPTATGRPDFAS